MQTIAFYSLKGGVGKTASAVNIACHAARRKQRTLLWDLDPQGAASFYLGNNAGDSHKAGALIKGKQAIGDVKEKTRWPHLHLIPAHLSMRNADLKLTQCENPALRLRELIAPLGERYHLVVLDCPPTLSPLAQSIFNAVDYLFVPVIPTHLSLRALAQVRDFLNEKKFKKLKVVPFFTMVDRHRPLHNAMLTEPPKIMAGGLRTWIPYSTHIEQMGEQRAPLSDFAPRTPAAHAYRALWYEIAGKLKL